MANKILVILITGLALCSCGGQDPWSVIIPKPVKVVPERGVWVVPEGFEVAEVPTEIASPGAIYPSDDSKNDLQEGLSPESYTLEITPKGAKITAPSEAGAFYARQSLIQMIEATGGEINDHNDSRKGTAKRPIKLRCCTINDSPRFSYRGLHFDVSRHFRSKEFILKQIDAMSALKLNVLHFHLTDAAGWRLQVDSYPRLCSYAAWRPAATWEEWSKNRVYAQEGNPEAHGGYYSKEDIKEIVEYARQRHVTVIPEIEMPGHSEEVTAAYPFLSCDGQPSDLCPGNEDTFEFIEAVLTEVMEIFPSRYIHIGGDEASKKAWKTCPKCQKRMREEGLADVDELQSYLINRVERFVNSKGRRIIGWDEILQGGLAPDATVMSWRGTGGGVEAIRQGHDVVMTPGKYCYLNNPQDAPILDSVSKGGYLSIRQVYEYEPAADIITVTGSEEDVRNHLLGVQACLWTEHVPGDDYCEYLYYPRAFATAEVGWTLPENKDYDDFRKRAIAASDRMREKGYTVFDLRSEFGDRPASLREVKHKAVNCPVTYSSMYSSSYTAAGDGTLTDGVRGGWTNQDGKWQGFLSDVDVTIDLGKPMKIKSVAADFMQMTGSEIYMPARVEVHTSKDGSDYTLFGEVENDVSYDISSPVYITFKLEGKATARYVRLNACRDSVNRAWLFTDEVIVR